MDGRLTELALETFGSPQSAEDLDPVTEVYYSFQRSTEIHQQRGGLPQNGLTAKAAMMCSVTQGRGWSVVAEFLLSRGEIMA